MLYPYVAPPKIKPSFNPSAIDLTKSVDELDPTSFAIITLPLPSNLDITMLPLSLSEFDVTIILSFLSIIASPAQS